MLDVIAALVAEALEISGKEVAAARDRLLAEQAGADARYAATSALDHPEGSTTPINEAYRRAQTRLARLRRNGEKTIPKALAQVLAIEIARQRRDEAEKHMRLKDASTDRRLDTGIHDAARDFLARLIKHGVHPHHLKQLSAEIVAVIADLIAWKAKDARFADPFNPWRDILGIYAGRVIEKPGKCNGTNRSVPGTPTRSRHPGGTQHYMFNEMVQAGWGLPMPPTTIAPPLPVAPPVPLPVVYDCSIYPDEAADTDMATDQDDRGHEGVRDAGVWERAAARYDANPDAMSDLEWDILFCGPDASVPKIVHRLTDVVGPSPQGDFAPFIAAAQASGNVQDGLAAYRLAGIKRIADRMEAEAVS